MAAVRYKLTGRLGCAVLGAIRQMERKMLLEAMSGRSNKQSSAWLGISLRMFQYLLVTHNLKHRKTPEEIRFHVAEAWNRLREERAAKRKERQEKTDNNFTPQKPKSYSKKPVAYSRSGPYKRGPYKKTRMRVAQQEATQPQKELES